MSPPGRSKGEARGAQHEGSGVFAPGCALVVAIVGAESSGKTTLAAALHVRLAAAGLRAARVDEALREFCARQGRTPHADEQAAIAEEQTRRIEQAARTHEFVVADTTALMTAVYSELVFGDRSLYARAEAAHRRCDLTLLMALDLPWQADGLQRDGAHVRAPVDALLRAALARTGQGYSVVAGRDDARAESAWRALQHRLAGGSGPAPTPDDPGRAPVLRWHCERCGDPDCERRLLLSPLLAHTG